MFCQATYAQVDSNQILPQITVRDIKPEQIGYSNWRADSLPIIFLRSASDQLASENPISIRTNGLGTLATVSARGMGPSHTPVFWNGINLQSPMNGVVDAALLPIWPGDQLEIRYGGQSAVQSSGAMGGSVMVASDWLQHPGFFGNLGASLGSFGKQEALATVGYGAASWRSMLRADWQQAKNNYPFKNTAKYDFPTEYRENNHLEKHDFQQFNDITLNAENRLKTGWWNQAADREIPQPITAAPKESRQQDRSNKAFVLWEHNKNARSLLQTKIAWFDEWIAYRLSGDADTSKSRSVILSSEYNVKTTKYLSFRTGGTATAQWAQADGYADSASWYRQRRLAGFASAVYQFSHGQLSGLLRQEWAEGQAAPFTWSLAGNFKLPLGNQLRFHCSRNFNMPTFNDRFWNKWGRPDLLPEYGYSTDCSWSMIQKSFRAEITAYNILIDNWILWQPGSDGIFRPGNLKKVWSRGLESMLGLDGQRGRWIFHAQLRYQYTKTTNIAVYNNASSILGKQLLYVPKHTGAAFFRLERGPFSCIYTHQWTGSRFVTTDNDKRLSAYQTGNFSCKIKIPLRKKRSCDLDVNLTNCWNTHFQFFEYQPLPGRAFQVGAAFLW
ncbi:MAG: TonB-dependent receptor plug domain-containing protein [Bacteroidota bacterium]